MTFLCHLLTVFMMKKRVGLKKEFKMPCWNMLAHLSWLVSLLINNKLHCFLYHLLIMVTGTDIKELEDG